MTRWGVIVALPIIGALTAGVDRTTVLGAQPRQAGPAAASSLEVLQLRPNFYVIGGAGANISVQVGQDGVIVVDAGIAARADLVVAAIKKITEQPIRYVIDTSAEDDHVGGNEQVSKAGRTLFNTNNAFGEAISETR